MPRNPDERPATRPTSRSADGGSPLIAIFQGFVLQAAWEPDQDLESCFTMIDELVPKLLPEERH
jgi:hypothetical protein